VEGWSFHSSDRGCPESSLYADSMTGLRPNLNVIRRQ
jgi:hypothetical protein